MGASGPRVEVSLFDGSEESGLDRTVSAGVVVPGKLFFGLGESEDAIGGFVGRSWRRAVGCSVMSGVKWDGPEAVVGATCALDDDHVVFQYFDIVFGEYRNAVVIA